MNYKNIFKLATSLTCLMPVIAQATNGMNMEGFGPISTSMGGASMAYDNGTAAMMNNPATLSLMAEGSQLDLAIGVLGPDVKSEFMGMGASSGGDQYIMPAVGWVKKQGQMAYGVGMFSQGGMGTEYAADSLMAAGTGQDARSEVGVGRLMAPFAYSVNDQFNIGGSIDYVWGGLDMKMPMTIGAGQPGTFSDFLGPQKLGEATVTPTLGAQINGAAGMGYGAVAINFSNSSDFSQETSGSGFAGKIGMTYAVNQQLTFGASYHLKTSMDDWEGNASMLVYDIDPSDGTNPTMTMTGKMVVKDFQWPATMAFGVAYTPDSNWLLVADLKVLKWSDVMKDFNLVWTRDDGEVADITFYQDWDDQNVISLGGAYKMDDQITLRAGVNLSTNPVPDEYVHPLFPAIVENHYTFGVGYAMSKTSGIDFSMVIAPEVSVTNSNTMMDISHSQLNWQLEYSTHF